MFKPKGQYEIDWSNSLTKGLVGAWILDEKGAGQLYIDLVGNNSGQTVGSTIAAKTSKESIVTSFSGDGTTDRINLGSIDTGNLLNCVENGDFSVISKVNITRTLTNAYPRVFDKSDGGSAANGFCLNLSSTKKLEGYIDSSYLGSGTASLADDEPASIAVCYTPGDWEYYINGAQDKAGTTSKSIPSTTTNAAIGNWNHSIDREFPGSIYYVYVFNIKVPLYTVKQLANNPYQILKPIRTVSNDSIYSDLFSVNESTGTGTGSLSSITGNASGAVVSPGFSGSASGDLLAIIGTATGQATAPNYSGAGEGDLSQITGTGSGSVNNPGFSGVGVGLLQNITGNSTGAVLPPEISGSASGELSIITGGATGEVVNTGIVGSGDGNLQAITGLSSGVVINPSLAEGYLQAITGNATGTFIAHGVSGVGVGVLPKITGYAYYSSAITITANSFMLRKKEKSFLLRPKYKSFTLR